MRTGFARQATNLTRLDLVDECQSVSSQTIAQAPEVQAGSHTTLMKSRFVSLSLPGLISNTKFKSQQQILIDVSIRVSSLMQKILRSVARGLGKTVHSQVGY